MVVTLRKRARTLETPANPKHHDENPSNLSKNDAISGYEQCRDERIKENLQRMQKLGILDLSLKLKSDTLSPKRSPRKFPERKTTQVPLLTRRSSRLQRITPVSYSELRSIKGEKSSKGGEVIIREGLMPEIYTEEDDKLLGSFEASWVLFVDGCGPDGKRIYDPVKGKTCHQCRQKTLGHRTSCSQCNIVQGQFCGDCLFMRYGENVLEAKQNPDWICPACRGICNCSLCRLKKGWAPTGSLYRKVSHLGFKSVAHYLIQTRRSQTNSEDPVSPKKPLLLTDMVDTSQQNKSVDSENSINEFSEDSKEDKCTSKKELHGSDKHFISTEYSKPIPKDNKEKELCSSDEHSASNVASDNCQKLKIQQKGRKPIVTPKPSPDCIAGRLRKRPNRS
ncbi:uncharacterized protein LOC143875480 [Tasmannia lanceolata]|uniref:uncharacterized protein LOC143875480 n=1 Tax=Tasmannia lanceolata TaxID=3420 RepID=UPI0040641668